MRSLSGRSGAPETFVNATAVHGRTALRRPGRWQFRFAVEPLPPSDLHLFHARTRSGVVSFQQLHGKRVSHTLAPSRFLRALPPDSCVQRDCPPARWELRAAILAPQYRSTVHPPLPRLHLRTKNPPAALTARGLSQSPAFARQLTAMGVCSSAVLLHPRPARVII